ncbi:MAG: hypothetical protein KDA86_18335 [Planctomycetaceae bacterium]|nr:hypothetical protein [Planctomycetaceae bacterium]
MSDDLRKSSSSAASESDADASPLSAPSVDGLLSRSSRRGGADEEVAQKAGDFIAHLRSQLAELDRREQNVNAQYSALDQERRRLRFSAQQSEEQLRQREEELTRREAEFVAKMDEWESSWKDVHAQEELLKREQSEFRAAKDRLETEVAVQLEVEREVLAQERAAFERKVAEQEQFWQSTIGEIDEAINGERAKRTALMERELGALEAEILEKRQWWDEEKERCQRSFEEERTSYEFQLAALSTELVDLKQQRLEELDEREHDLKRREVDIEKRSRFHESHLENLRRTLDQRQKELDQQKQSSRARHVEIDQRLRRHANQMRRFRDLLEHREESLERERDLLAEAQGTIETLRAEETARFDREKLVWEQECESHRADMQRQQDLLTLHAQNLDSRRSRLDKLRDELEESHRETLEMRLSIEQSWAQLSQTFGEETSRQRIEQARAALHEHFEQVRQTIDEQRQTLDEAHERLQEQRDEFRIERQEFSVWVAERENQLRQQEALLQEDVQVNDARESQWRQTRERWLHEKIEAESVIRQLLSELEAGLATSCPFDPLGTPAPQSDVTPESDEGHIEQLDDETSSAAA